ncbi:cadherin-like domain-containing protein [Leucobacter insecticola]|uniref:Cadherin-like domain-containing protein n=1 Tax=Leucobacter insecticola TaxID=2714934 RepID=A0A6G8FHJ2_9MICO|nr:Ig-like domain-containing protein [Leucobacter insecticola]QIM15828.1 cadherin-like domain-containing protein [Leucobacter insecticola]
MNQTTGEVTFNAAGGTEATPGTYTFTVSYTDNLNQVTTQEYTAIVLAKPVATGNSATVGLGVTHTFPKNVTPAGLASAGVIGGTNADMASIDANGDIEFAGSASAGTYSFTVTYTDAVGQFATAAYSVTVQGELMIDVKSSMTIGEGGTATFTPIIDDVANLKSATASAISPAGGAVTVDQATGEVVFEAGTADPGTYTFDVTYIDDLDQETTVTYTVTVQAAPISKGDITETVELGTESVTIDVLGVVTGTNLQPLTDASFTQPAHGTVALNADGMVVYTPEPGFVGTVSFATTVVDDLGQSVVVNTTITVLPAPPTDTGDGNAVVDGGKGGLNIGGLSVTGGTIGLSAAIAAVLLGLGAGILILRRKRREVEEA